ncbi:hypothetical protein [Microvirga lotononidis]|uniref:Uncharacterized protein n=1 Tax=Microvirga lotononidis TaxID=864069 RepID=I4YNU4_9HYPH|nr:hypothetical protein [Microvirga lotononidis]EIM25636.1 hypothetical protein MicloDRAFT_00063630 [Microvirga lotononidis]WQO26479.1 hypothetical protein U0023_17535 [Microvirga lotononidis]
MPHTSIATGSFSSRKEANRAVQRLVSGGFARNSIAVHERDDDDGYDLEIHTRRENLRRAERLIHDSAPLYVVREKASDVVHTARSYPLVLLGAGILTGFLIYNLIPRASSSDHRDRRRG